MNDASPPGAVSGLLLAAGGSRRLGRPKQLIDWQGEALVRRAARALLGSRSSPVLVVTGCQGDAVGAALDGLPVETVFNRHWRHGMASSIRCGMKSLLARGDRPVAVVICVCDQPRLSARHVDQLISCHESTGISIVASRYAGVLGVPAVFAHDHFDALGALRGDSGARDLIRAAEGRIAAVDFPGGKLDIDRDEDLPAGD